MGSLFCFESDRVAGVSQCREIHTVIIRIGSLRKRWFVGLKVMVDLQAGTGGNQLTDQDVFLQADKMVNLALDRSVGQRKLSGARDAFVIPMRICV